MTVSKSFNIEDITFDYNNVLINPYRVLGIPPWSSMKEIKGKYRQLILKYHPDKTKGKTKKEFEIIQSAYEKIKSQRESYYKNTNENKDEEIFSFKSIIQSTFKEIIIVEIVFSVIYYISFWTYSIQKMLIGPLFYIVLSCVIISHFFPHFFNDGTTEFSTGLLIGFILFIFSKLFKCLKKKENKIKEQ